MLVFTLAALLAYALVVSADIVNTEWAAWASRGSNDDLMKFVTRPDLTPPKWEVRFRHEHAAAPGYIFVAPYDCLDCSHRATTTYVTQQIGPVIYTQDGDLVWSGIDLFPDRKVFDFQAITLNDQHHLSLIMPHDSEWHPFADGMAMVLDNSYEVLYSISSTDLGHPIDLHEWNIINDGKTALVAAKRPRDATDDDKTPWKGKVMESYFWEVDLHTGTHLFNWTASDHIPIRESTNEPPRKGETAQHWDWFHLNSLDKDDKGNYLVSARAMDTIFLVSPEGKVLWRLGGPKSSFTQDFEFSRQHHARIRRQTSRHMIISFFDNAVDDRGLKAPTAEQSSLMMVQLDLQAMTATQTHRHPRTDGGLSEAKGNVQYLPTGQVFGGWGENALVTEYSKPGGELVYEASFASKRFANYRAYKMEFVGQPKTRPTAKAFITTNSRGEVGTMIYVSWNGATEVTQWRYYSYATENNINKIIPLGEADKTGFETAATITGYHPIVFVEALDVYGTSLANSSLSMVELPVGFHDPYEPLRVSMRTTTPDLGTLSLAFIAGIGLTMFSLRVRGSNRHDYAAWRPAYASWGRKGR